MFCGCLSSPSSSMSIPKQIEAICSDSGDVSLLKKLMKRHGHINVNFWTFNGYTPLHMACQSNFPDVVNCLLEVGADPTFKAENKDISAFHVACWSGAIECVRLLLKTKPSLINDVTSDIYSGLHYGCWGGNLAVTTFLVSAGADIKAQTKDGYTPMIIAGRCGHADILEYLINLVPPLDISSRSPSRSAAARSISRSSRRKNNNSGSGSNSATDDSHFISKDYYIGGVGGKGSKGSKGAMTSPSSDATSVTDTYHRLSAAHEGGFKPSDPFYQPSPNTENMNYNDDDDNNNVLASISKSDRNDVDKSDNKEVDLISMSDSHGCTALHHASWEGHVSCVRILLRYGCDPLALDVKNRTPADLAKNRDIRDLIKSVGRGMLSANRFRANENRIAKNKKKNLSISSPSLLNSPSAQNAGGNNGLYDNIAAFSPVNEQFLSRFDGEGEFSPYKLNNLATQRQDMQTDSNGDTEYKAYNIDEGDDETAANTATEIKTLSPGSAGAAYSPVDYDRANGEFNFALGGGRTNLVASSSNFVTNNPVVVAHLIDIITRRRERGAEDLQGGLLGGTAASSFEQETYEFTRLIAKYPSVVFDNIRDVNNRTLLMLCVDNGKLDLFKVLIKFNIKLIADADYYGYNCFHIAVMKNLYHIAEYIIASSLTIHIPPSTFSEGRYLLDINTKNCFGRTALHFACEVGNIDMVKLLIGPGKAEIHVFDSDGFSPLHLAVMRDNSEVVLHLCVECEYGHKDLMAITKNGDMCSDLAKGNIMKTFLDCCLRYRMSMLNIEEVGGEANKKIVIAFEKSIHAMKAAVVAVKAKYSDVDARVRPPFASSPEPGGSLGGRGGSGGDVQSVHYRRYGSPGDRNRRNFLLPSQNQFSGMIKTESGSPLFSQRGGVGGGGGRDDKGSNTTLTNSSKNVLNGDFIEPNREFKPLKPKVSLSGKHSSNTAATGNSGRARSESGDSDGDVYSSLRRGLRNYRKAADNNNGIEDDNDSSNNYNNNNNYDNNNNYNSDGEGYKSSGSATSFSSISKAIIRFKRAKTKSPNKSAVKASNETTPNSKSSKMSYLAQAAVVVPSYAAGTKSSASSASAVARKRRSDNVEDDASRNSDNGSRSSKNKSLAAVATKMAAATIYGNGPSSSKINNSNGKSKNNDDDDDINGQKSSYKYDYIKSLMSKARNSGDDGVVKAYDDDDYSRKSNSEKSGYYSEGSTSASYSRSRSKVEAKSKSGLDSDARGKTSSYDYIKTLINNKPVVSSSISNSSVDNATAVAAAKQKSNISASSSLSGYYSDGANASKDSKKANLKSPDNAKTRSQSSKIANGAGNEINFLTSNYFEDNPINSGEFNASYKDPLKSIIAQGFDVNRSVLQLPLIEKIQFIVTRFDAERIRIAFRRLLANARSQGIRRRAISASNEVKDRLSGNDDGASGADRSFNPETVGNREQRALTSPLGWLQKKISVNNSKFKVSNSENSSLFTHNVRPEVASLKAMSPTGSSLASPDSLASQKVKLLSGSKADSIPYFEEIWPCISENEDCLWRLFDLYRDKPSSSSPASPPSIHYLYPVLSVSGLWALLQDMRICPVYCSKVQLQNHLWGSSCGVLYKTPASRKSIIEGQQVIITFRDFIQILSSIAQQSSKMLIALSQLPGDGIGGGMDRKSKVAVDRFSSLLRVASSSVSSILKEKSNAASEGSGDEYKDLKLSFNYLSA